MKKNFIAVAAAVLVAVALALPTSINARAAANPAAAPAVPAGQRMGGGEHPDIREAIRNLERAKVALEKAEHDFGGHRSAALEHVKQALGECHAALEFHGK